MVYICIYFNILNRLLMVIFVVSQLKTRLQLHKKLTELSQLISHSLLVDPLVTNQNQLLLLLQKFKLPLKLLLQLLQLAPAGLNQITNAVPRLVMSSTLMTTTGVLKMVNGKHLNKIFILYIY